MRARTTTALADHAFNCCQRFLLQPKPRANLVCRKPLGVQLYRFFLLAFRIVGLTAPAIAEGPALLRTRSPRSFERLTASQAFQRKNGQAAYKDVFEF